MSDMGLKTLSLVCVPVTDSQRSVDFYVDKLGLEKRVDQSFGDGAYRWVEVYPPSGTAGIALAPPPPGVDVVPTTTGITLTTDDAEATRDALAAAGVDVDAAVARMGSPVPPMFWLRDPDGHSLMIVEPESA